jgi:hypothetical protein
MNNNDDGLKFLGYVFGGIVIVVLLLMGFQVTGVSIFGINLEREKDGNPPVSQPTMTPYRSSSTILGDSASSVVAYPSSVSGTWEGTYSCLYEGKANVTLEISGYDNISAIFYFSANRENPSHPSGAFNMTGTYDSKEGVIKLEATTWINEPAAENGMGNVNALTSSVRMDMVATVTDTGARIKGQLDPISGIDVCNNIELAKVR